jgi:hypothetical protein
VWQDRQLVERGPNARPWLRAHTTRSSRSVHRSARTSPSMSASATVTVVAGTMSTTPPIA